MILTPFPLRPALAAAARPLRDATAARTSVPARPVLQSLRAPQQLCLDLQPRPR